jgi:uncharacterized membrane protein
MTEPLPKMDDYRLEIIIGRLLQIGVAASMIVVACGGLIYLRRFHDQPAGHAVFVGEPAELESLSGIVGSASRFDPLGLIQFGVLVLIATPIARVVFSIYGFWLERDRFYVVVTLTVLAALLAGLW